MEQDTDEPSKSPRTLEAAIAGGKIPVLIGLPRCGRTTAACIAAFNHSPKSFYIDARSSHIILLEEALRVMRFLQKRDSALVLDNADLNDPSVQRLVGCAKRFKTKLIIVCLNQTTEHALFEDPSVLVVRHDTAADMLSRVLSEMNINKGDEHLLFHLFVREFGSDLECFLIALSKSKSAKRLPKPSDVQ